MYLIARHGMTLNLTLMTAYLMKYSVPDREISTTFHI